MATTHVFELSIDWNDCEGDRTLYRNEADAKAEALRYLASVSDYEADDIHWVEFSDGWRADADWSDSEGDHELIFKVRRREVL